MIILPMAGLSSRFFKAGYTEPKYKLQLDGLPVFDYALRSFAERFGQEEFLIVLRRDYDTEAFVQERLNSNGLEAQLVVLDQETRGQADTVAIGLETAGTDADTPLTIFNIDSFRPGFSMTAAERSADGYLETFLGEGDGWSFVAPAEPEAKEGRALRVVEKERISDLCCTGLYYFRTRALFEEAYAAERENPSQPLKEHYIAPIYNQLIGRGARVLYRTIPSEDVVFCGVPAEYEELRADPAAIQRMKP
ncbi:hypothetical protein [Tropicimonas marinistellae]|uniref:hypothetical protein n=1 Tax=Tropicimonas marinistellae TaxID=1739787 RepID=UPI0008319F59|nr:hypothetical protein [Tropicimonas marinistellae]